MSGTVKFASPRLPFRMEKERNVMYARDDRGRARKQAGFALILAILSLMLLTFLGLTLAATTSTELQIATNYRWSQQALYNAEAGLQAAKLLLAQVSVVDGDFRNILPTARAGTWSYGITGAPWRPAEPVPGRAQRAARLRADGVRRPFRRRPRPRVDRRPPAHRSRAITRTPPATCRRRSTAPSRSGCAASWW
jgi:hypothetical protein